MSTAAFAQALSLPEQEGALLWSMRAWALGFSRGWAVAGEIQAMYDDLRAPEAATLLEDFMQALNDGAGRMLEVNCVCHPLVSDDELDLLDAMALCQQGRREDAASLLEHLAVPGQAGRIAWAADALAAGLAVAGVTLPRGGAALRQHGFRAEKTSGVSACVH